MGGSGENQGSGSPGVSVHVRIANDAYVLRGPGGEAHLRAIAGELDRRMRLALERHPRLALHQAATLCALEVLEELVTLRAERDELLAILEETPAGRRRRVP